MKTRGLAVLSVGVFLGGWGVARAPSAEACGRPLCIAENSVVPLPPGAVVPANVPALVVLPPPYERTDELGLRLRTEAGADVEARVLRGAHDSGLLVPAAPLVPGAHYRLEGAIPCSGGMGAPAAVMADFTAGAEAALPTVTGTLRTAPEQQGAFRVWDGGASCSSNVSGSQVTLGFTPAPELVPFLPWVHWTLEVDGQTWATARHGAVDASGGVTPSDGFRATRDLLTVFTVCGDVPAEQRPPVTGLAPGRHVATLRPVFEQSGVTLPALEVPLQLTCPAEASDPEAVAPRPEGCAQAGGGFTALGLLATLRLWRGRMGLRARQTASWMLPR